MLDWIKNINKEYPEFWKNYLSKFDKKASRYVVLSTETTGLNPTIVLLLAILLKLFFYNISFYTIMVFRMNL